MNKLYKKLDDMEGIIKVLKVVNQEREIVIGNLIVAAVEKDEKIKNLKAEIVQAKFVIEGLAKK